MKSRKRDDLGGLRALGSKAGIPSGYAPEVLEAFANRNPGRDYRVTFTAPARGKEAVASAGGMRLRFDPWVRRIPWRRKWQPTLLIVFLPGTEGASFIFTGQRTKTPFLSPWCWAVGASPQHLMHDSTSPEVWALSTSFSIIEC